MLLQMYSLKLVVILLKLLILSSLFLRVDLCALLWKEYGARSSGAEAL